MTTGGVMILFVTTPQNGSSVWVQGGGCSAGHSLSTGDHRRSARRDAVPVVRPYLNTGTTAAAVTYDCAGVYLETDY